jgi:hypothetical protein
VMETVRRSYTAGKQAPDMNNVRFEDPHVLDISRTMVIAYVLNWCLFLVAGRTIQLLKNLGDSSYVL